jgi:O-antigen/teichoic acid export membrane protein
MLNLVSIINQLKKSQTLKDTIIVLASSILSSGLGFVFVFTIARRLGPQEFGVYSTIINYTTFLSAVIDLGISLSLINFVNKTTDQEKKKQWISTSFFLVLISTLIIGLISTLIYSFSLKNIWKHGTDYSLSVFLIIAIIAINLFFLALLQALKKFWQRSILDTTFALVRIIITYSIIILANFNLNSSFLSIIYAYCIALIYALFVAKPFLSFKSFDVKKIKPILSFSKWIGGINFAANLYGRLDVLMLAAYVSTYTTGIYAAASRFITIFPLVVSSFSSVVAPRFASFNLKNQLHSYFKKTLAVTSLIAMGMLFLVPLAKFIILTAYDISYQAAVPIFQILVITNIPLLLSIPATNAIIYFFKKPNYITLISLVQLIGLVLLNVFLIPKVKEYGPVYSLLLMNVFGMLAQYLIYFFLHKKYEL